MLKRRTIIIISKEKQDKYVPRVDCTIIEIRVVRRNSMMTTTTMMMSYRLRFLATTMAMTRSLFRNKRKATIIQQYSSAVSSSSLSSICFGKSGNNKRIFGCENKLQQYPKQFFRISSSDYDTNFLLGGALFGVRSVNAQHYLVSTTCKRKFGHNPGVKSKATIDMNYETLQSNLITLSSSSSINEDTIGALVDEATVELQRIFDLYDDIVTVHDCNTLLKFLATASRYQKNNESSKKALAILKQMNELYERKKNESVRPNTRSYIWVMEAFANKGDIRNTQAVLDMQLYDYQIKQNTAARPNQNSYLKIIFACSHSRSKTASETAKDYLAKLIDLQKMGQFRSKSKLDHVAYVTVMNACARNGDLDGTEAIWHLMIKTDVGYIPYAKAYSILINACSKSSSSQAVHKAKHYLLELKTKFANGDADEGPNEVTYSSLITTCFNHCDVQGAFDVLQLMEDDFLAGNQDAKPNIFIYGTLVYTLSKSTNRDAPLQSKTILLKMIEMHSKGTLEKGPSNYTYNYVMNSYASCGDVNGVYDILELMENDYKSGNSDAKPDIYAYNVLLNSCCISKDNEDGPSRARAILFEIIDLHSKGNLDEGPNAISYGSVMQAYANCGNVEGTRDIFKLMEEDYMAGNIGAKPNYISYSILIHAISKSRQQDAADQAKGILMKVIDLHSNGDTEERPCTILYNTVLNAYASRGDYHGARTLFNAMEGDFKSGRSHAKPDFRTYSTLIKACLNCKGHRLTAEAKLLLKKVKELHSSGDLEDGSTTGTYNYVMNAFVNHRDIRGACDVFQLMNDDFQSGNKTAQPNVITYSTLINGWSRSTNFDAPGRVMIILKKMIDLHSKGALESGPNTITYNSVIQTYASRGNIRRVYDIFQSMQDDAKSGNAYAKPDIRTYNILIHAWSKSGSKDAPAEIEKILKQITYLHQSRRLQEGPNKFIYTSMIHCLRKFRGTDTRVQELRALMKNLEEEQQHQITDA